MSQIITRNAHARSHANSELPKVSPNRGRGSAPIPLSSQRFSQPFDPSDLSDAPEPEKSPATPAGVDLTNAEAKDPDEAAPRREDAGGAGEPDDDPSPPGGGPNGGPDGNDDEDDEDPLDPNNLTVRELLRFLRPILADRLAPPPGPVHAPLGARRLKVNSPEEFDGHSPKKLKSFLVACNNAFRADPDMFRLHDKRVSYALSYLRGPAQCHFDTQLEDEEEVGFVPPDWLNDWARFAEELRDMFGDPNAETTAEAELDSLRMGANQKFADFVVEFNTLSSQVNWGDRALRHRMKQGLPDRIKDSLALVQEPVDFVDWKRLVQSVDQRYWERETDIRRDTWRNQGHLPAETFDSTPDPIPIPTTPSILPNQVPPIAHLLTPHGGLMQSERDRRMTLGLCLYCGGQGHQVSECSKARRAQERMGRVVPSVTATESKTPITDTH
jgi:hypothetical protein